jgi:hypothetical protein
MSSTAWAIRKRESRKERRTGTRGHAILLHLHCGSGGEVAHMLLPLFLSKKSAEEAMHRSGWRAHPKKLLVLPSLLSPVLLSFLLSLFLIAHTLDVSDFLVMRDA